LPCRPPSSPRETGISPRWLINHYQHSRRRSAPDVAIVELQLHPHPLVHGRHVNFQVFSARSDCGYHHSCDDKHELNRGQHQQIAHLWIFHIAALNQRPPSASVPASRRAREGAARSCAVVGAAGGRTPRGDGASVNAPQAIAKEWRRAIQANAGTAAPSALSRPPPGGMRTSRGC
jgi:hypothetical protein